LKIYQDLKGKYGSFATTERAAEKLANRQEKNQTIGLTGKILAAGQIAADPSRWPQAALTALGNKAVQERGSALAAIGADKLADVLKATPETFGRFAPILQHAAQRGSHSLAVTHYLLTE